MVLIGIVLAAGYAVWLLTQNDWRRAVYWLLLYMPYVGVLTLAMYPAPPVTRVVKDVVFIVPIYLGLATETIRRRTATPISLWIKIAMAVTTVVVIVQAFNSEMHDTVVALVGIKTWIFYYPLLFAGRALVRRREDLVRVFLWMGFAGLLPLGIGLAQALLLYTGHGDIAYAPYGEAAAAAVTQAFSGAEFSRGVQMTKTPGIFTFVTQYYNFTLAMVAIGFAIGFGGGKRQRVWLAVMGFAALAGMLSGARGAFVMVPLMLLAAGLMAEGLKRLPHAIAVATAAVALMLLITRAPPEELSEMVKTISINYAVEVPMEQLSIAGSEGLWGHGTGVSTGAAGAMVENRADYSGAPLWILAAEMYFAKALVELGVIGLISIAFLLVSVLFGGWRALRQLRDRELKGYGAAIFSFLVIGALNEWKGPYLDLDPLNVYFWLWAGILLSLPELEGAGARIASATKVRAATTWRPGVIGGPERLPAVPALRSRL